MGSWLLFQEGCHLSMKRLSFRFTMVFGIMVFISCVIVDSLLIFTYYKKELKQLEDNIQKMEILLLLSGHIMETAWN